MQLQISIQIMQLGNACFLCLEIVQRASAYRREAVKLFRGMMADLLKMSRMTLAAEPIFFNQNLGLVVTEAKFSGYRFHHLFMSWISGTRGSYCGGITKKTRQNPDALLHLKCATSSSS
jgi:hypothetical protein